MPNTREYYENAISKAKASAEHYQEEAIAHLEAVPQLDREEAMDSLETVEKAVLEIRYYVDRIQTLTNLLVKVK